MCAALQVVLLPIAAGAWLNRTFPSAVRRSAPFAPLVAVGCTVAVCASVLARNAAAVTAAGPRLLGAICALHAGGFGLGYAVSRVAGVPERQARTNSIEVRTPCLCRECLSGSMKRTRFWPFGPRAIRPV